eukprot:4842925-Amphidinium_carterae.3
MEGIRTNSLARGELLDGPTQLQQGEQHRGIYSYALFETLVLQVVPQALWPRQLLFAHSGHKVVVKRTSSASATAGGSSRTR